MAKKSRSKFFYFLHNLHRVPFTLVTLLINRPKRYYLSPESKRIRGGALAVANHTTFFDPIYMLDAIWYRRQYFVTSQALVKGKIGKAVFTLFLCIIIDKENFSVSAFRKMERALAEGEIVTVFPEGKVNREEGLAAFKSGAVRMALRTGKPIVPFYIDKERGARLHIYVGEPIHVSGDEKNDSRKANELLAEREKQLADLARRDRNKKTGFPLVYAAKIPEDLPMESCGNAERDAEIAACGSREVQREKYFVWLTLDRALRHAYGCSAADIAPYKDERGKWRGKIPFSLSHSHGYVAVALGGGNIGVDIENTAAFFAKFDAGKSDLRKLTERTLYRGEKAETPTEFLRLWTAKESIFKFSGGKTFLPQTINTKQYKNKLFYRCTEEIALSVCCKNAAETRTYLWNGETFEIIMTKERKE